ncbi:MULTISPECIES: bifunctional nicotinamidase/pyrazinamidase [unclassified Rhizobium]|uniref:bifunctional nicotinamidase/pyrazinamidase n=1 Tax=unclassified Rhizobium TaxID=2613769 RepID=UPI001ADA8CEA|nr:MULTISPECIES: bifunctional nicotinamidase/pyrazinamidase [unclassified Rhizobium]MBO9098855.1 bifunctional nicotinamidase/pyrazinamidase [Rhizobium sp. L58/93]MBO9132340.1 bifunctional nicotinamidase/pyrazinamidase [Rhizobium sp. B209b/85]MBO9169120.1 bifunctional nicotinamidase/pyrazinamidase [Rhizobium sp. L245/93]MBO9185071.1 bifunctional nicotinamidase/pyrazinamidase [Rhizobium sp. E27B/91]QXZ85220.1 bifunctional nicotinamidase/pyrazinamidase [Rhizobium sp. K1/93]
MKALLLIDIQTGFCPGGNLAVPEGDEIVPVANRLIDSGKYDLVVASQDWHPEGHGSFASSHPGKNPFDMGMLSGKPQMMWPDHCVQDTPDAALHPDLHAGAIDFIQQKGQNPEVDSYSAFRDNDQAALTGLADYLRERQVTGLDLCGLATDYCVKFSAIDAVEMLPGVRVRFIEDASRGIDPAGVKAAIDEMRTRGVAIIDSAEALNA